MFFDMHTDILYHIVYMGLNNKKNIIKDFHLKQLEQGNIRGGIWCYYTDINHPLCEFEKAIEYIFEELERTHEYVNIVKTRTDFNPNKINVVLGFESLQPVKDLHHLQSLFDIGFRHAMLTWNEENHFATGVVGSQTRGLTEQGEHVVKFMDEYNMILDISHANRKTVDDIFRITNRPVIASHSNIDKLCPHRRNLTDEQIAKIVNSGGIIGITAVKGFVNPDKPSTEEMVKHIDYLKNNYLIDHIGLGFDFMDYINGTNLSDLNSAIETNNLIEALKRSNYNELEIAKITSLNAVNIISKLL